MLPRYFGRFLMPILTFIIGSYMTLFLYLETCSSNQQQQPKNMAEDNHKMLLLVLIISAPGNIDRRQAIRETWLQSNGQYNVHQEYINSINIPRYQDDGFIVQSTIEEQIEQFELYRKLMNKQSLQSMMLQLQSKYNIIFLPKFIVGLANQAIETKDSLQHELDEHNDLILLNDLNDSYQTLTRKLIAGIEYAVNHFSFKYLLKCDDDSYAKLNPILTELDVYDTKINKHNYGMNPMPILYWGYFNGNAQIKERGKWMERNFQLCDHYLPYALGGGYIISHAAAKFIAENAPILSQYNSEDISMGIWLSPLRNVYRKHDIRFDTAYKPRHCQSYHIVLHKCSIDDMHDVQRGIWCNSKLIKNSPKEYFYNWKNSPSQCCDQVKSL